MDERLKTDCICMDVMTNAYKFMLGEIGVSEFISAHNFFGTWFFDYNIEKTNLLNAILIIEIDSSIKEYNQHQNSISKEKLRIKIKKILEMYSSL